MNNIDLQYKEIVNHIIRFGTSKSDRTGTGTKSLFGWQITHNMSEGFPLITVKETHLKSVILELIWFLKGSTNIKWLVDNECYIWVGDAYKNFKQNLNYKYPEITNEKEFIEGLKKYPKWGELGPIYGQQWRSWYDIWDMEEIDQIANLINLLKTDPDSRRMIVSAWNVSELEYMVLQPCHQMFQCYTRELSIEERINLAAKDSNFKPYEFGIDIMKSDHTHDICDKYNIPRRALSLQWTQRSVDVGLGLPFNIASYGLLLTLLAKEVNMLPEKLIGNLGDIHIYNNHLDEIKVILDRVPYKLPSIEVKKGINANLNDIILIDYKCHPKVKLKLSN